MTTTLLAAEQPQPVAVWWQLVLAALVGDAGLPSATRPTDIPRVDVGQVDVRHVDVRYDVVHRVEVRDVIVRC